MCFTDQSFDKINVGMMYAAKLLFLYLGMKNVGHVNITL